jgi:hypothetical protein
LAKREAIHITDSALTIVLPLYAKSATLKNDSVIEKRQEERPVNIFLYSNQLLGDYLYINSLVTWWF